MSYNCSYKLPIAVLYAPVQVYDVLPPLSGPIPFDSLFNCNYQLATYCSYQLNTYSQLSVEYVLRLLIGSIAHDTWVQVPVHLCVQPLDMGSNSKSSQQVDAQLKREGSNPYTDQLVPIAAISWLTTYCSYQLATYSSYTWTT